MKVQLVTLYRMSHLQRYGVTIRGNVTSVDPPLEIVTTCWLAELTTHAMSEDGRVCNVVEIIGFGLFIGVVSSLDSAASNGWLVG
jgi:hypothetical protein